MRAFLMHNNVSAVHLVLTQAHREETRKQAAGRVRDAFTKLQRRAFWKSNFKGGTWALEFTKGKDGLHHAHLHIIAFRRTFFDIAVLRDEWETVTGDSRVIHLRKIDDITEGLREVVKYVSKPMDVQRFDTSDLSDFLRLRNMRMFGTFGEFRKFARAFEPDDYEVVGADDENEYRDLVEGCACPECGEPLFDVRMSGDQLPAFYDSIVSSSPPP
jgi:hypothetical protein